MKTYGRFQLVVSHGEGCSLFDTDGKRYLDFAAGISTCCLGHANERLITAVEQQIRKVHHVSNLYYIPQQGELARRLVASTCADRAFFCNSGAESNEAAIKLARKHAYTKLGADEPVIITALNSFHGRTLATITATGQPKYQENFGPLPQGFEYVPYNDCDALRTLVKKINGNPLKRGRKLAAILLEPLQGEGGITPATKEFFQLARELCDETGALLMADEVQTGMGRSGKMWGYMHHEVGAHRARHRAHHRASHPNPPRPHPTRMRQLAALERTRRSLAARTDAAIAPSAAPARCHPLLLRFSISCHISCIRWRWTC